MLYDELKSEVKEIAEDFEWVRSKDGQIILEIENWIEKARLRLREEYPDTLIYIGRGWVNPMELFIGGVVDDDDTQKFFESYFNNQTPPVPIHFKIIIQNWNIENDSLFDLFPIILCYNHTDTSCNHKKSNGEEEPKEPLCIVTEIAAIIFLVSFTNFILFIDKHGINLTDMHLHLRDQVQDSNTDLDTQLRHSDTDLDTDHDTFVEDHDTIHSYHDTNHDTKRVPLTNK